MGTAGFDSPRLTAFNRDVNPKGLELVKSDFHKELGVFRAEPNAVIRQGQWVKLDANQFVVPVDTPATDEPLGISKWNKQQFGRSVIVAEAVTVNAGGTSTLDHTVFGGAAGLAVRSLSDVESAVDIIGGGTDYTFGAPNVLTWVAVPPNTADGAVVFATYSYALTDADLEIDGRDFRNQSNNDMLGSEDYCTIITDWTLIATTEYDPAGVYTPGAALYLDADGRVSSTVAGPIRARVVQPPQAGGGENVFMSYIASP